MDDALKQLHDLHLPSPPPFWPPAPGWWLLAIALAALTTLLVVHWRRARRRRRPLRLAERALDGLLAAARQQRLATREFADAVNVLLKRALIHGAGQPAAAPLTGAAWLAYLDRVVNRDTFSNGAGSVLGDDRFSGRDLHDDPGGLHAAARDVLRAIGRPTRR